MIFQGSFSDWQTYVFYVCRPRSRYAAMTAAGDGVGSVPVS